MGAPQSSRLVMRSPVLGLSVGRTSALGGSEARGDLTRLREPSGRALAKRDTSGPGGLLGALAFASILSLGVLLSGLPLLALAIVGAAATGTLGLCAIAVAAGAAWRAPPAPLASQEVRVLHAAILAGLCELERAAASTREAGGTQIARARALVAQAHQLALLTNPTQHYLACHDRAALAADVGRLRAQADAQADGVAKASLREAATQRERQLTLYDQLVVSRTRTVARLEVVRATLDALVAATVCVDDGDRATPVLAAVDAELDAAAQELDELETLCDTFDIAPPALPPAR